MSNKPQRKHKIIVSIEYVQKLDTTADVIRSVELNDKEIYSDRLPFEIYLADKSVLRQFEQWLIEIESLAIHKRECRQDRLTNSCNFMGFLKKAWREVFAKQVNLKS